ncbi:hypothetical protein NY2A_b221L [Paramecium bursaria Chlorella virus NY2A]|uniref:Uncharacterized protein b221L n=1 Tax=Paramecium bursaria Chlorella virus NY2A TaxID=46021 RepID=A7IW96_PBCVN|nr:hypothetical protein NY2A_b221L [Paramecium bursaria Chlorella virus NY2A]ABT14620.1 hypothetical protein NY2A_b221L [Paramecium bursaria Chlorella virus NY2A]
MKKMSYTVYLFTRISTRQIQLFGRSHMFFFVSRLRERHVLHSVLIRYLDVILVGITDNLPFFVVEIIVCLI